MKNNLATIIAVVALAVAGYGVMQSKQVPTSGAEAASRVESVYDRVMRTGVLRCGYVPWPPYWAVDPNTGAVVGFNLEIMEGIADITGLKMEYVPVVNGQQVQDLASGKIDANCGDGPWNLSTIKYIDFSKSYFYIGVDVYVRSDEQRFVKLIDLNSPQVTFVGADADLSVDLVQRRFPKATLKSHPAIADPSQLLLDVVTGKADAVIIDPLAVGTFSKNNPGQLKKLFQEPVAIYSGGFSVLKGQHEFLQFLDQAVDLANNLGLVDQVLEKYDPDGTKYFPADHAYRRRTQP